MTIAITVLGHTWVHGSGLWDVSHSRHCTERYLTKL